MKKTMNISTEINVLYDFISNHAKDKKLANTLSAIQMISDMVEAHTIETTTYHHCLLMCRMMLDLNMQLSDHEQDVMYAAALCHILPEEISKDRLDILDNEKYGLDPEIHEIVRLLYLKENVSNNRLNEVFQMIQQNKLALIISLADRANIAEQLYVMSSWQVRRYIYDTRRYYFTMCIYAKEHYYELISPVGILLEKLRNLTDVSEILLSKFESMEIELTTEILSLREQNATIKGILQKLTEKED